MLTTITTTMTAMMVMMLHTRFVPIELYTVVYTVRQEKSNCFVHLYIDSTPPHQSIYSKMKWKFNRNALSRWQWLCCCCYGDFADAFLCAHTHHCPSLHLSAHLINEISSTFNSDQLTLHWMHVFAEWMNETKQQQCKNHWNKLRWFFCYARNCTRYVSQIWWVYKWFLSQCIPCVCVFVCVLVWRDSEKQSTAFVIYYIYSLQNSNHERFVLPPPQLIEML